MQSNIGEQKMQKLFGKLNSKMAIIGTVSAIAVVLCIVGIVIGG